MLEQLTEGEFNVLGKESQEELKIQQRTGHYQDWSKNTPEDETREAQHQPIKEKYTRFLAGDTEVEENRHKGNKRGAIFRETMWNLQKLLQHRKLICKEPTIRGLLPIHFKYNHNRIKLVERGDIFWSCFGKSDRSDVTPRGAEWIVTTTVR